MLVPCADLGKGVARLGILVSIIRIPAFLCKVALLTRKRGGRWSKLSE